MANEVPEVYEIPNGGGGPRGGGVPRGGVVGTPAGGAGRVFGGGDTGPNPEHMALIMDRLANVAGGRQLLVLNTHADWDHYWGNGLFTGPEVRYPAPILGHQIAGQRAESDEARATLAEMKEVDPAA